MITLEQLGAKLGFDDRTMHLFGRSWKGLTEGWQDGMMPEFLSEEFFCRYYTETNGPAINEMLPRVRTVIELCRKTPEAAMFAYMFHRGVYRMSPVLETGYINPLPFFGENFGILSLMVAFSGAPQIQETHRKLGLPTEIFQNIMKWIGGTIAIYQAGHNGIPGHDNCQTYWLRFYVDGKLFPIGRLEYLMHRLPDWAPMVFRDDAGHIEVLTPAGTMLDAAGLVVTTSTADKAVETAFIEEDGNTITGIPIAPDGHALVGQRRTIDTNVFKPVCTPWSLVPSMHIPGGRRMPLEEVKDSLRQAKVFFKKYFHREVPMFVCESWILNPAWRKYAPDGNMTALQLWAHTFQPCAHGDNNGTFFVFGRTDKPVTELPATNRAQKMLQQAQREDGCLRLGALFVLADEI